MIIYFSHPTFTFRTKTERECIKIIEESFEVDKIINPADFGLRKDPKEMIRKADMIVGVAVSNRFTFLVWNEMKVGKESGAKVNTFMVEDKNDMGPLVKGVPEHIEKLDPDESQIFREKVLDGEKESIFSLIIGNWRRRF